MTRPSDPDPRLLDALAGELPAEAAAALEAELTSSPELRDLQAAWAALAAAEAEAFEPAAERALIEGDAPRIAAWVRATVRAEEAAKASRTASAPLPGRSLRSRGWARVLAFSVAAHVVALGVLALVLEGRRPDEGQTHSARVEWIDTERGEESITDLRNFITDVQWRELVREDLGTQLDDVALMEQERLPDEISRFEIDRPAGWGAPEYPHQVTVSMLRRSNHGIKSRRLDLLGFDAKGTLRAVARGLAVLAHRQDETDGLFHGADSPASVSTTALATLAFLGEGHTSKGRAEYDQVVKRAVAGLRARTASSAARAKLSTVEVGTVALVLCEDYMLSYGSLTPNASARRSEEIVRLADFARTRLEAAQDGSKDQSWLVWALDAAQRSGVVRATPQDRRQFQGWVASTADPAEGGSQDAQAALSVGLALLYAERGSEKPRFKTWSRANAEGLLAGLKPTGEARAGDDVGDTALILLALQVSYRAY